MSFKRPLNYPMTAPLISVVMPVRDSQQFISAAVDSILNQSFKDYELIIVDGGSSDKTPEILGGYAKSNPNIRIVAQKGNGIAAALNLGCAVARGQYIARMDADDISLPHRFERQINFLEEHREVAVLGSAAQFLGEQGLEQDGIHHPSDSSEIKQRLRSYCAIAHPTVMMRRSAFEAAGGYTDICAAEDYDLWLRIANNHELANLTEVLLHYRVHTNQASFWKNSCETELCAAAMHKLAMTFSEKCYPGLGDNFPESVMKVLEPEEIEDVLMGNPLKQVMLLLKRHKPVEALLLQDKINGFLKGVGPSRRAISQLAVLRGKIKWMQRRHISGAIWIARGYAINPAKIKATVRRRLRIG